MANLCFKSLIFNFACKQLRNESSENITQKLNTGINDKDYNVLDKEIHDISTVDLIDLKSELGEFAYANP